MEKISCETARDLLPLYCDDVCSQDSRRLVERHLQDCRECSSLLEKMKTECCVSSAREQRDEEIVKHMASVWKRSVAKSFLKGILVAACICLALAGIYWGLTRVVMVPVPGADMEAVVDNITDEQVEISITVLNGIKVPFVSMAVTDEGKYYITLKRGVIAVRNGGGENWTVKLSVPRVGKTEDGARVRVKEIYCGAESDGIRLWRDEQAE